MPYGQPAQLANLKPPWQPGKRYGSQRSRDVNRAITQLRHWSPKAVEYCAKLMTDENEPSALRLKAACAIIEKAIPTAGTNAAWNIGADSGTPLVRITFVDANDETSVTIQNPTYTPREIHGGRSVVADEKSAPSSEAHKDDALQFSFDIVK